MKYKNVDKARAPLHRCPRILKIGNEFSGMNMPSLSLRNMNVKHVAEFDTDKAPSCRAFCKHIIGSKIINGDITTRSVHDLPAVDFYHFSPPCQPYALDGSRLGRDDERSRLWKHSMEYIKVHKPRLVSYEMVRTILFKRFRPVLVKLVRRLRKTGYKVHLKVLNTKEHGIPHDRRRLYMVASWQWERKFTWPKPVPLKYTCDDIIKTRTQTDNPGRLPPRSDTISGRRRRLVVKTSFRFLLKQRIDPKVRKVFTDIGCSTYRARPGSGLEVLPSMTATRAAGRDWWVSTRGSRITTAELFQFQGLEAKHWKMWKDTPGISAGRMRHMLGNSLSCNVAERVFGRALWCTGLVSEQPKDRWEPDDELEA